MTTMYGIQNFGEMLTDSTRMDAYERALRGAVRPGSVVLDIGTGTGIFALIAARLGARRVFAIEPSDAIFTAREIASANGLSDRVEFIQDLSSRASLPERADVIVSDLHGVLPHFGRHIESIADARRRHLAPGGVMIPRRDIVRATVVHAPEPFLKVTAPWSGNPFEAASCALANAEPNESEMPITSPVERISGPSTGSVPTNLLNGKTASFTDT